jgi:hypothetical protein
VTYSTHQNGPCIKVSRQSKLIAIGNSTGAVVENRNSVRCLEVLICDCGWLPLFLTEPGGQAAALPGERDCERSQHATRHRHPPG